MGDDNVNKIIQVAMSVEERLAMAKIEVEAALAKHQCALVFTQIFKNGVTVQAGYSIEAVDPAMVAAAQAAAKATARGPRLFIPR